MFATISIGPVIVVVAVVGFIYGLYNVARRTRKITPLREEVMKFPILYRHPHPMKYSLNGNWSLKTLAAMELIVTEGGVGMAISIRGVSDVLGSQWWARSLAFEVGIERIAGTPLSYGSDWVVIRCNDEDNCFEVAISPAGRLNEMLAALKDAGGRFDV